MREWSHFFKRRRAAGKVTDGSRRRCQTRSTGTPGLAAEAIAVLGRMLVCTLSMGEARVRDGGPLVVEFKDGALRCRG